MEANDPISRCVTLIKNNSDQNSATQMSIFPQKRPCSQTCICPLILVANPSQDKYIYKHTHINMYD